MPTIVAVTTDTQIMSYGVGAGGNGWDEARQQDGNSAVSTTAVATYGAHNVLYAKHQTGNKYYIYRSFFAFDVSSISVAPASATFKLFAPGGISTSPDAIIVKAAADATINLSDNGVTGDFKKLHGWVDDETMVGRVTAYSSIVSPGFSSAGAYNDFTLNAAALADIASLGVFKIAVIEAEYDYTNTPYDGTPTWTKQMYGYFSSGGDAAKVPYIDYVAGASGWGGTSSGKGKKLGGTASGDAKKFVGVATGNTGKILGV